MAEKIIALDAGHGMGTAGKRCLKSLDPGETREWFLNDRIMDKVEVLLAAYECTVIRIGDTTGAKDVSLASRVKTANSAGADIYISMHHNAGLGGRAGGGTVVFYSSGKSERAAQAQRLYDAIVSRTALRGNRSQKVINKGFYVIRNTSMPAFLVENGFMDSPTDVPIILSEQHAVKTAAGVAGFIVDELLLQRAGIFQTAAAPAASADTYYQAYTGKSTTLSAALTSLGISSTYSYRRQIAAANGITGYTGTASQNTQMYNLLTAGLLKRV